MLVGRLRETFTEIRTFETHSLRLHLQGIHFQDQVLKADLMIFDDGQGLTECAYYNSNKEFLV